MSDNSPEEVKLDDLVKDDDIYPREKPSSETVKSFADSLEAGYADFPKIRVQRLVLESGEEELAIIDGVHRRDAYQEYNRRVEDEKEIEEIEVAPVISADPIPKSEHLTELRVEAIKANLEHGDRLSRKDKKEMCRRMTRDDPEMEISEEKFGSIFGVPRRTVNDWIGDIRSEQKENRNSLIYKLSMLGWKQEAIAERVDLNQNRISQIINNGDFAKIDNEYEDGKPVSEIADYYGLNTTAAWGMILEDKSDQEVFEELGITLKSYDVWNYSGCNKLMGEKDYPGRIPGQLVMNALYYYTEQGDLVADFMAGGGTTVDACLLMNRKCFCSDINSVRDGIVEHDLEEGLPEMNQIKGNSTPDLVFADPPYWSMKKEDYDESSVSNSPLEHYYKFVRKFAEACHKTLDDGGKVAFLIQNQTGRDLPEGEECIPHTHDCANIFRESGFELRRVISCPQGTHHDSPQEVTKAKEERSLLGIVRDLLIFQKKGE